MTTNEANTPRQTAAVAAQGAQVAPEKAAPGEAARKKKGALQGQQRAKKAKPAAKRSVPKKERPAKKPVARPGSAKANVIEMIQRKGGATLEEIMKETGWQAHTTRGFISTLPKKAGPQVNSTRRESDKARVYEVKR
jgi:hypothetical protein